jgi:hypothetical protein
MRGMLAVLALVLVSCTAIRRAGMTREERIADERADFEERHRIRPLGPAPTCDERCRYDADTCRGEAEELSHDGLGWRNVANQARSIQAANACEHRQDVCLQGCVPAPQPSPGGLIIEER